MYFWRVLVVIVYSLFISFFLLFLKYGCDLYDSIYSLYQAADEQYIFDYIIVGAGSAGSFLANKLSRNGRDKVLLLEAGKAGFDLLQIPSVGLLLQQTPFDWEYKTVPQKNACLALDNNVSLWPMGKILGGTSMLNNMLYVRGHQKDFDEWFRGKDDYNFADIIKQFEKLETEQDSKISNIFISDLPFTTCLPNIVEEAAKTCGYPISNSLNCELGFSTPKANLHKGKRWTSADNFKNRVLRNNLLIKTNCLVEKVLFKADFEAYGVKYSMFKRSYKAFARKAVILSAGVIGTPKILMLSGIGKKDHLEEVGIKSVINLPVGDNLQDHLTTGLDLILLNHTLEIGIESMLSPMAMVDYFLKGTGPWTTTGCESMAFFNLNWDNVSRPDIQFMIMPLGIKEDDGYYLRKLVGISDKTWHNYFAKINRTTMTILPILLHPKSRGTVRLAGKDPYESPLIDPRYLTHPDDVNVLIEGIKLVKTLVNTKEFKAWGAEFNTLALPDCAHLLFDSKPYWECYLRHFTITSYHPVGTCKMGHDQDSSAVVNFNFQVKGTNKLYVTDGSVLPSLSSGNINAPIMLFADMAADAIEKTYDLSSKRCSITELFMPTNVC